MWTAEYTIVTDASKESIWKAWADVTSLPLAKMEFAHELKEDQDGLHVTHRITITGLFGFLFVQVIGKDTARDYPKTISNLIRIAKADYK